MTNSERYIIEEILSTGWTCFLPKLNDMHSKTCIRLAKEFPFEMVIVQGLVDAPAYTLTTKKNRSTSEWLQNKSIVTL